MPLFRPAPASFLLPKRGVSSFPLPIMRYKLVGSWGRGDVFSAAGGDRRVVGGAPPGGMPGSVGDLFPPGAPDGKASPPALGARPMGAMTTRTAAPRYASWPGRLRVHPPGKSPPHSPTPSKLLDWVWSGLANLEILPLPSKFIHMFVNTAFQHIAYNILSRQSHCLPLSIYYFDKYRNYLTMLIGKHAIGHR